MAEVLRAYAREGIGHVQLVMDPITRDSIAAFAPVLRSSIEPLSSCVGGTFVPEGCHEIPC